MSYSYNPSTNLLQRLQVQGQGVGAHYRLGLGLEPDPGCSFFAVVAGTMMETYLRGERTPHYRLRDVVRDRVLIVSR